MINPALIKKEIKEIARTYRIWLVPLIFLFIGFSAPASAKFLPAILKGQLQAKHIKIQLPEPSALEAFAQYSKNLVQLGVLAVILLTMGLISEEKAKGVLAQVLTKPVKRAAIITSKFFVNGIFLIMSLAVGAAGCYLYTVALFGEAKLKYFAQANLALMLYMLLIFTVALFFSGLLSNQIMAGGLSLLFVFGLSILPAVISVLDKYTPAGLVGLADKFFQGSAGVSKILWPAITTIVFIALLLFIGGFIFERQEF